MRMTAKGIPDAPGYLVQVEKISTGYNIIRGEVSAYRVHVSDYLTLTRQADMPSPNDGHAVYAFAFAADGVSYRLLYDPGSPAIIASLVIETRQTLRGKEFAAPITSHYRWHRYIGSNRQYVAAPSHSLA